MPLIQHMYCDVVGCGEELDAAGGFLSFQSSAGTRGYYFCEKHWKMVAKTLLPLLGVKDENKMEDDSVRDRNDSNADSGVSSGKKTKSSNIRTGAFGKNPSSN